MPYMGDFKPKVRAYMACTAPSAPDYKDGAVTLVFINQDQRANQSIVMYQQDRFSTLDSVAIVARTRDTTWPPIPPPFPNLPRIEYVMTAPGGDILSRSVELNGKVMELDANGDLPVIH